MRKNSPRHWLHAILDLLPVILIPVFMIYSHRHTIDSYSVTRQELENQPYNFYQYVQNGKPINTENWLTDEFTGNQNINYINGYIELDTDSEDINTGTYCNDDIEIVNNTIYYLTYSAYVDEGTSYVSCFFGDSDNFYVDTTINNVLDKYSFYKKVNTEGGDLFSYVNFSFEQSGSSLIYIKDVQLFNLTEIFGSGNEPTKEEFENMLTQDYYNYGNNYVDNYVTISKTYNDTDIMSQFTYNLYNSVDKYFNMGNVFGMNNVYSWFETNIFHGTAPLYIYIVWNIVLYEFVMDLLMLLYSLFMWFIDMCQNLIDRCYSSSKGGN